jgi:hypothetical protein
MRMLLINGGRHGKGEIRLPDGTTYFGEWVAGRRHGKGECKYSNDHIYIGMYMVSIIIEQISSTNCVSY